MVEKTRSLALWLGFFFGLLEKLAYTYDGNPWAWISV